MALRNEHMKTLLKLSLLLVLATACKVIKYVPVETKVEVEIHDTTRIHTVDTLVKVPDVSIRDFVNLEDTLTMRSGLVTAKAWIDEPTASLRGSLEQTGKVPAQIVEKERVVYKDSIRDREVPVPVEVEKIVKVVPWWAKALSAIGVLALLLLAGWIAFKFFLK